MLETPRGGWRGEGDAGDCQKWLRKEHRAGLDSRASTTPLRSESELHTKDQGGCKLSNRKGDTGQNLYTFPTYKHPWSISERTRDADLRAETLRGKKKWKDSLQSSKRFRAFKTYFESILCWSLGEKSPEHVLAAMIWSQNITVHFPSLNDTPHDIPHY